MSDIDGGDHTLLSDNLDLQARSTLIVKWINGCNETKSLIETLIASVEDMKIEFALDVWGSQSNLMDGTRNIEKIVEKRLF